MDITTLQHLQTLARDRRTTLGLSQQAVAERAGVSRKWVSEFELGKGGSEIGPMLRLMAALELRLAATPLERARGESVRLDAPIDLGAVIDDHRRDPGGDGRDR